MADANQAAEELARAMAKVTEELALLGKNTQQTQSDLKDAQVKAKYGIENYSKATEKAAEGVMALGGAAAQAGRAMLDGKKGAAALNGSLDELSTAAQAAGAALALMVPGGILIKGLIAGVTALSTAAFKYAKEANIMADQLHKGYQGLAKAGGAAADGMSGLKRDAQKLGYAMGELDQMVSIVAENSKDFALFAGSVTEGRKKFADLGQALEPARNELMNMGLSIQDINEGAAGYIRLQTRLGNAQKMSVDQLAKGAQEYLKEQDALTKLTGQSRAEMEQQRERALQGEQFAAKIRELQLNNQGEAAERLLKLNSIYEAAGPKMASAFQASVTGNLANKDAQEANLASQGEMIRSTQAVIANQMSLEEAAQRTGKAMGNTADTVGTTLGQLGAYNQTFGPLHEQLKLAQLANGDIVANAKKIAEDQKAQRAGQDQITDQQSKLVIKQIEANKAMTDFIFEGIAPAQRQMMALTDATKHAANALNKVTGNDKGTAMGAAQGAGVGAAAGALLGGIIGLIGGPAGAVLGAKIGTVAGAGLGAVVGGYLGGEKTPAGQEVPKGADGGMFSGPTSGYLAMLHGTELVIPEDQLMGKVATGGMAGAGGEQLDKMNNLYKEMLKDTIALEKLTEQDLKKTRDFSRISDRLRTLKTDLINDEIDMLEEQNDILEKMLKIAEQAGGKDAAAAMKRTFAMARMGMGSMPGMGAAGGGMQMPSAPGMPSMGGAQGLKGPEEHQPVGSGGQGLKGAPKLATVRSKTGKSTSVNAEYAPRFQSLIDYLDSVGYEIHSLGGYVDRDVRGKPGVKSVHAHGGAIDINPGANPMGGQLITDMPENISAIAKQLGLGWGGNWASVKDAMHFSVASHEGGDIKLSDGGVAVGPNSGYPATLHGEEAVIPLNNGGGNFIKMFEAMAEGNSKMVAMMEEMVRAQKNSVDVQTKMLRAQS